MNTVVVTDKSQIKDESLFSIKMMENVEIPLYLDKKLISLWGQSTLDLVGWSNFKRLALV